MSAAPSLKPAIEYPSSDGMPMAENTLQYQWIVTIQGNLDLLFADDPTVFVGADNLIYPVEGDNRTCYAPDVYIALGRPKGHRGSYQVWNEDGIFPQVIFEILSPGNRPAEMRKKFEFYERYGVEEYYVFDPDRQILQAWHRVDEQLKGVELGNRYRSPLLSIIFKKTGGEWVVQKPNGRKFYSFVETAQRLQKKASRANQRATRARQQLNEEKDRADAMEKARRIAEDRAMSEAKEKRQAIERAEVLEDEKRKAIERANIEAEARRMLQKELDELRAKISGGPDSGKSTS
jgi:Uma2 family endonuclease